MPKIQSPAGAHFYRTAEEYKTSVERESEPEIKLWRAVLGQALYDAFGPERFDTSPTEIRASTDFLRNLESTHFKNICELADFDHGYIKRKVRQKFAQKFVQTLNSLGDRRCKRI